MSTSIASLKAPVAFVRQETLQSNARAPHSGTPGTPQRFTVDGDDRLERRLQRLCREVADGVRKLVPAASLQGVLLAGGYGRGEGGVLITPEGDRPYNDMEFYVFVRGSTLVNDRRFKAALHELGETLSPQAGLEVEFKILSLEKLRRAPVSMFSHDFVVGHRWVIGDDSLLAGCDHHRVETHIPQHEATRLLFNRGSGLLYAAERLRRKDFSAEDADFVGRNLAKAQLGIGDAILAACGAYHWSCTERHERLKQLRAGRETGDASRAKPYIEAFRRLLAEPVRGLHLLGAHEAGVVFKLHPRRSQHGQEALAIQHAELSMLAWETWRILESFRLRQSFATPRHYAFSACSKCPEHPAWRNVLVNARAFGIRSAFSSEATRYPRERLFHALTFLLWDDLRNPTVLAGAQQALRTTATDFPALVGAYERLWHRFN